MKIEVELDEKDWASLNELLLFLAKTDHLPEAKLEHFLKNVIQQWETGKYEILNQVNDENGTKTA